MPLRTADAPAHETTLELLRRDTVEQPGILHRRVRDPAAGGGVSKPPSEDLDIGQLRHG
jgi:hypothetical protein